MKLKQRFSKFVFGGVIFVAIAVAATGFVIFERSLNAMQLASQENIAWSASQLERELSRFRDSLGASQAGHSNSSADINQRFDVLWSRVAIFQRGNVGQRLHEYDLEGNVVGRLFEELKRHEVAVVSISSFDFTTLGEIHAAFYPYSDELSDLSRRIFIGEEQKAAAVRAQMRQGANFALYASIFTVVLVIGAMIYFVIEGRVFRKLAKQNHVLAERFKQASLVKSRFLTMMSHELRTPMNGVLGLLAVARNSEADPAQKSLLDQADRSANRMLGMLTDILDFAALENAELDLESKPFFTNELLLALPELLGPVAHQVDARLNVTAVSDLPIMLKGDITRLRRAYALIITYFLETAGAREIEMRLSYADGCLNANIYVDYLDGGWSPDLIFGDRSESDDSFASEGLGPSVARVLVAKMGGEIRLGNSEDGKILLEIDVPVPAMETRRLKTMLKVQSAPMEMICKSTLSTLPIDFVPSEGVDNAEVVLMESGAMDEQTKVAALRAKYPAALIFGIGRTSMPSLFDFTAEMPLEAPQLKNRMADLLG